MDASRMRVQHFICRTCRIRSTLPALSTRDTSQSRSFQTSSRYDGTRTRRPNIRASRYANTSERCEKRFASGSAHKERQASNKHGEEVDVGTLEARVNALVADNAVPAERDVTACMKAIESAAQGLIRAHNLETADVSHEDGSATSAILSLDARTRSKSTKRSQMPAHVSDTVAAISLLAFKLVSHPNVFITTDALVAYTKLQALLSKPESLPEVFDLFATKPAPIAPKSSSEMPTYAKAKPDAAVAAIPVPAASLALKAAIHIRDLPLALSVIITSYQRPAFRRAKFLRRATLPLTGVAAAPLAAWALASNMASIQTGIDPALFTQYAFAGLATYLSCVGTIGYVAITSSNDQMKRVTWVPGVPLRERWEREEERAAVDSVVCAWGFKDNRRWGEEEGQDWAELKEWAGRAGMIVDRVSLMEGMQ